MTDANSIPAQHYDQRTIFLHWISAAVVLTLWVAGQTIDWFPRGTLRVTARSIHIALGLLCAMLLAFRLSWRASGGSKLPTNKGPSGQFAVVIHKMLYFLLACLLLLGIFAVWVRGDTLFNLFTIPAFDPGNKVLAHRVVSLHGLGANMLLALAALHAAAAIWHHLGIKDGVLRRMWPSLPQKHLPSNRS